jgi:hypothetical protein
MKSWCSQNKTAVGLSYIHTCSLWLMHSQWRAKRTDEVGLWIFDCLSSCIFKRDLLNHLLLPWKWSRLEFSQTDGIQDHWICNQDFPPILSLLGIFFFIFMPSVQRDSRQTEFKTNFLMIGLAKRDCDMRTELRSAAAVQMATHVLTTQSRPLYLFFCFCLIYL